MRKVEALRAELLAAVRPVVAERLSALQCYDANGSFSTAVVETVLRTLRPSDAEEPAMPATASGCPRNACDHGWFVHEDLYGKAECSVAGCGCGKQTPTIPAQRTALTLVAEVSGSASGRTN